MNCLLNKGFGTSQRRSPTSAGAPKISWNWLAARCHVNILDSFRGGSSHLHEVVKVLESGDSGVHPARRWGDVRFLAFFRTKPRTWFKKKGQKLALVDFSVLSGLFKNWYFDDHGAPIICATADRPTRWEWCSGRLWVSSAALARGACFSLALVWLYCCCSSHF